MRRSRGLALFAWLVFAFLLVPLILIVVSAFGTESTIRFPIKGFTLKWFVAFFKSRTFISSIQISLKVALMASLLGIVVSFPAAYWMTRKKTALRRWLLQFFLSPSLIPGVVMGYALYQSLVIGYRISLTYALLAGHVLIVLPFAIRILAAGFEQFDSEIEEAAWSLGCTPNQAFLRVVVPNMQAPVLVAFLMSFVNSFNNLPVSMYLKGPGISTLPQALMNHLEYNFDPTVSAVSVILMIITAILMLIVDKTMGLARIAG